MNELYQQPSQPDPEQLFLRGQEARLSTEYSVYSSEEIGVPEEAHGTTFRVAAEIGIPEENSINLGIAIVRTEDISSGMSEVFAVGLELDEEGKKQIVPNKEWTKLTEGVQMVVGRTPANGDPQRIDGQRLFSKDFSRQASRDHLKLRLENGVVVCEDTSSNGSNVYGFEEVGSDTIYDTQEVPRVAVESDADLKEARYQAIDAEMQSIRDGLSEQDKHFLWQYASGTLRKAEAQRKGDGHASSLEGSRVGEASLGMSQDAKDVSRRYTQLMGEMSRIINS